jgi:hypothetical protein
VVQILARAVSALYFAASLWISVLNGNLEVPVYFIKAKRGYAVRKMGKRKMDIVGL